MNYRLIIILALSCIVAACNPAKASDDLPQGLLNDGKINTNKTQLNSITIDQLIESYQDILSTSKNDPDLRRHVRLRLADLEIERQENIDLNRNEGGGLKPNYKKVIQMYHDFISDYPEYQGNDHALYQIAKAFELNKDIENTLTTLQKLANDYPSSKYYNEAQFRQGEIKFVLKRYAGAALAYQSIVEKDNTSNYYEIALYKYGWSHYKSGKAKISLDSFFTLLDIRFVNIQLKPFQDVMESIPHGEKELIDDTFRVIGLIFASINDNNFISQYFSENGTRNYEYLIYNHLASHYLKKERIQDAVDTLNAFANAHPNHWQTPLAKLKNIDSFRQGGFSGLLLTAKQEFVDRYHPNSGYWNKTNTSVKDTILPHVKTHLDELTRYYHAKAQQTKIQEHYIFAARWYSLYLMSFPDAENSSNINFLYAELLFENKQYADATLQYEKTAYEYPKHKYSAESGYSALLAYNEHKKHLTGDDKAIWHHQSIMSSLRYSESFPKEAHVPSVLSKAASDLFEIDEIDKAIEIAYKTVEITPRSQSQHHLTTWTVIAHASFDKQKFEESEKAYKNVLKYMPKKDPGKNDIQERLAASVYKQAEQHRDNNDLKQAATHFLRVGVVVPTASIRNTAEFDAATAYMNLKNWKKAIKILLKFRKNYPSDTFQNDATAKLAVAYLESEKFNKAAIEYEAVAKTSLNIEVQREATIQAAKLYHRVKNDKETIRVYKNYVKTFPVPLEQAIEVRNDIAIIYKINRKISKQQYWLKQIVKADRKGKAKRTDRTKYLAASAALELAEYSNTNYLKIKLVRPLQKNLKKKKKAMEKTLKSYKGVLDYGIVSLTTASTYQIANIYSDFSQAILTSQRPRGLSDLEREQYDILLEEQAFPFEEGAIVAHELNTNRVADDIYDEWVRKSFSALTILLPARYAKLEKSEDIVNALN